MKVRAALILVLSKVLTASSPRRSRLKVPARSVILHHLVGLCLVAALLALTPAAYASPPDQTWIAGLYDNADHDDVILFITCGLGAVQPSLVWSPRMVASVVGLVSPADTPFQSLRRVASGPSRAPPLA